MYKYICNKYIKILKITSLFQRSPKNPGSCFLGPNGLLWERGRYVYAQMDLINPNEIGERRDRLDYHSLLKKKNFTVLTYKSFF